MSTSSSSFGDIMTILLMLGVFALVCAAPFWLFRRYRRLYGASPAFQVGWSEPVGEGAFREGEQSFEQRVRVTGAAEWASKLGFFLGILGFFWTPLVLIGAIEGLMPMVTVGLPGLVVSWSLFFASRALLKQGPASAPLLRFAATAEILVNVWVVALVVLCTLESDHRFSPEGSDLLRRVLLMKSPWSSDLNGYAVAYSLQQAGVVSLVYAMLSFFHASLLLRAWAPLDAARRLQLQEATSAA